MSNIVPAPDVNGVANTPCNFLYLNAYNVQRIVYELIKNWMLSNTPASCGVNLGSSLYNLNPAQSGIYLDVAFNWQSQFPGKVPAVFIERDDVTITSPMLDQTINGAAKDSVDVRSVFNTLPIKITCVAASPVAIVENLADYIKQPLLYFRREVKSDFFFRRFELKSISKPALVKESKDNFMVTLTLLTEYGENWIVKKDDLKLKTVSMTILDGLLQ